MELLLILFFLFWLYLGFSSWEIRRQYKKKLEKLPIHEQKLMKTKKWEVYFLWLIILFIIYVVFSIANIN